MKCPHCNQDHPEGTKFCPETGKRMPEKIVVVGCPKQECPNYGRNDIPAHYHFCPECGSPLNGEAPPLPSSHYDEICNFHEGLARVKRGERYGYIDLSGREIIPCIYMGYPHDFSEGVAYVGDGVFIDKEGRTAIRVKGNYEVCGDFKESLCAVCRSSGDLYGEGDKYGFIDKSGKLVIECEFNGVHDFSDGLAVVYDGDEYDDEEPASYSYINKNGYYVIQGDFCKVTDFYNGYAVVQEMIRYASEENDGEKRTYVIDKNGDVCYDALPIDIVSLDFNNGVFVYNEWGRRDRVVGWIDTQRGIEKEYEQKDIGRPWGSFSIEGLMPISKGMKGYIDVHGDMPIGFKYDDAKDFSDGLAAIKLNELWGFIDYCGDIVIPCQYDEVESFREGRAVVTKNDIIMVIDKEGNIIV